MKPNTTPIPLPRRFIVLLLCIPLSFTAFCQPDYDFRNPVLVSGTALQINAVYRFANVKAGVDATVTIKNMTGGVYLSDIDGASGYIEALQPVIQVPARANGYVEFEINFFRAGTNTVMVQVEVPATPIDVDGQNYGDGIVKEFDILELSNGYVAYDMLGGELNMNISGGWVTGRNVAGVDYPGVDTTSRRVMFTTVNAGISRFTFRSGATSTSASMRQRLRSVYFKKFQYAHAYLNTPALLAFSGRTKENTIALFWNMAADNKLKETVLEKSADLVSFAFVANTPIGASNHSYTDYTAQNGNVYYRLKMTDTDNAVQYSNTLFFNTGADNKSAFKIYPSVIDDNATVNIAAVKNEQTYLQLFDANGRNVYRKKIVLTQGSNIISIHDLGNLQRGTYAASVKTGSTTYSQQVIIQ